MLRYFNLIDRTHIADNANCMIRITAGCQSRNQRNLHILGDKILQSLACAADNAKTGACGPRSPMVSIDDSLVAMHGSADVICG